MAEEVPYVGKTVLGRGPSATGGRELEVIAFDKEMEGLYVGVYLESAEFRVKEKTFRIRVYPNGLGEKHRGYLSVFLLYRGEEEVVVDLIKTTVGGVTRQYRNWTLDAGSMYGWGKWCSHEDVKKELVEGVLKLKMEVEMKSDMVVVKDTDNTRMTQTPWLLQNLYSRLSSSSDYTLMCQGQGVPCHRTILEGASPYFRYTEPLNASRVSNSAPLALILVKILHKP